jgi:hypothetical protein
MPKDIFPGINLPVVGIAVERIYFQPNVNVDLAISEIISASDAMRR